jgi:CPA2 family monovalent cation:H+ antiporter-2
LNSAETLSYLRDIVIFLVGAGLVVPLFHRLKASPVLGYLAFGIIVGPHGIGRLADAAPWLHHVVITDLEGVRALAELGVVFLLFTIGLELSFDRLWSLRRLVFGLGTLQVVLTAMAIALVALALGHTGEAATALGACLALSSTAIVMRLLADRRQVATTLGRTSFSVLLLQDLAVVPILFLTTVLGGEAAGGIAAEAGLAVAKAAVAVAAIMLVGRVALRPLFRLVSGLKSPDLFMAVTLLAVVGTAAVTQAAGLSMTLGAFLSGLLLAESEYRHEVEVDIEPFKGLLLGVFFMSVGMGIDLGLLLEAALPIAAAIAGLFAVKGAILYVLCRLFGIQRHIAVETALLLGQGGEFAFVIVGLAMANGVLSARAGQFVLIVTALSMAATPVVAAVGRRLATTLLRRTATADAGESGAELSGLEGHVILAGYGRVGRMLARILDAESVPYVAIDIDGAVVAAGRKEGRPVFYGDAARPEILRRLRVERAIAVVVTLDHPRIAEGLVGTVRREWPQVPIYARARDARHAGRLLRMGATDVVPEAVEASLQLAGRVLGGLGVPQEAIAQRLDLEREVEKAAVDGE